MSEGTIPYAHLVETALMGVVRGVLQDVAVSGMGSPHHFYITFRTDHPGVEMPAELRQRYRQEMTIVLQHQFWDLVVDETRFQVTLSFSQRPQRLSVPFAAIKVFADPGVEFGLQFTLADAEADAGGDTTTLPPNVVVASPIETSDVPSDPAADGETDDDQKRPSAGADIVTLDRFRKR